MHCVTNITLKYCGRLGIQTNTQVPRNNIELSNLFCKGTFFSQGVLQVKINNLSSQRSLNVVSPFWVRWLDEQGTFMRW